VASHTVFLQDGAVVEAGDSQAIFKNARDERTRAFVKTLASA